jgi:hypothetical protein
VQTTEGKTPADFSKIQSYYKSFHGANQRRMDDEAETWRLQTQRFREFWRTKMLSDSSTISDDDILSASQVLESTAKRATDRERKIIAVATSGLAAGTWPRILRTIHSDKGLRSLIDSLLESKNPSEQADLIDRIYKLNEGKRNNITGKRVVVLNDLLYAYTPDSNIAVVSMKDRYALMDYLGIDNSGLDTKSIGTQAIETRAKLLEFKERLGSNISTWEYSKFLYNDAPVTEWKKEEETVSDTDEEESSTIATAGSFDQLALEKVLRERKSTYGSSWAPIWAAAAGIIDEIKQRLLLPGSSLTDVEALQQRLPREMADLTDFATPAGTTASQMNFLQNQVVRDLLGKLPGMKDYEEIRNELLSLHVTYLGVSSFSTLASFIRADLFMPYHNRIRNGAPEINLPHIQGPNTDFNAYLDIMGMIRTVSNRLGITNMYEIGYYLAEGGSEPKWWVEKTTLSGHPLEGAAPFKTGFGESLWSPQTDDRGAKRYESMKKVEPGDIILHINQDNHANSFLGVSRASGRSSPFTIPQGTQWTREGPKPGFFVPLSDYKELAQPLKWDDIARIKDKKLREIDANEGNIFYDKNLDFNQEAYLTRAPASLVAEINDVYKSITTQDLPFYKGAATVTVTTPTDPLSIEVNAALGTSNQVILFGPPGTGKTYAALKYVKNVDKNKQMFITFHPSYSYEEFIEGLRPRPAPTGLVFEVVDGKFKALCIDAFNALLASAGISKVWDKSGLPELTPDERTKALAEAQKDENRYYLIIDEINRGDISKIFGELITLIESDKRLTRENEIVIPLTYSPKGSKFGVPPNLYIIGTMNTADRSIALIDVALRRRFRFIELLPDYTTLSSELTPLPSDISALIVESLKQLNEKLRVHYDRNHQIGHAYFIKLKNYTARPEAIKALKQVWFYEIIPLLQEYFYNNSRIFFEVLNKDQRLFSDPPPNSNKFSFVLKTPDSITDSDFLDFLNSFSKPT